MANIYVASAYGSADYVRKIHERLRRMGHVPMSTWAEAATGDENLYAETDEDRRRIYLHNCSQITASDLVLVLAGSKAGMTLCEGQFAVDHHVPVYWVGRKILLAWMEPEVTLFEDLEAAMSELEELARDRSETMRCPPPSMGEKHPTYPAPRAVAS